jgi:putative DNA primase/helicase
MMRAEHDREEVEWLEAVDAAVEEAGDDEDKQEAVLLKIKADWPEEAVAYAVRRFARHSQKRNTSEHASEESDAARATADNAEAKPKPEANESSPLLDKGNPYYNMMQFLKRHCFTDGVLSLYFQDDKFWQWNGRYYEVPPEQEINKRVWNFLYKARTRVGTDGNTMFRPQPSHTEAVVKCLKARLAISLDPPCWIEDGSKANGIVIFKNGIVDVLTGKLTEHTPKLWTTDGLDFDYDPEAKCPAWNKFLEQVFEGDPETIGCIEEQLGLGMTLDNKFQRAFLWIGPQGREGKGTLAYIQQRLVGTKSYVSLDFNDWLKGEFYGEALISKRVGIFPDAKFKEGKWYGQNFDPGGIDHASRAMLSKIIGNDGHTLKRKWRSAAFEGVLPMKLTIIANEVPNFNETILITKIIKIAFNVSFLHREDLTLQDKLVRELPGIANRCLAGYRRLCGRGRFIQPASGLKLAKELTAKSNVWQGFWDDTFILEKGGMVAFSDMYSAFLKWCKDNGREDLLIKVTEHTHLSRELQKKVWAFRGLEEYRPGGGKRHYLGLRLKKPKAAVAAVKPPAVVVELKSVKPFKRRL